MQLIWRICRVSGKIKHVVVNTKTSGLINSVEVDEKTAYNTIERFSSIHLNGVGAYVELSNNIVTKVIGGDLLICVDKYSRSTLLSIDRDKFKIKVELVGYNGVGNNHWEQTPVHIRSAIKSCFEAKDDIKCKYYKLEDNKIALL